MPNLIYIVVWITDGEANAQAYTSREAAERDYAEALFENDSMWIVESTVQD